MTVRPPRRPISSAKEGLLTESRAAARIGISKVNSPRAKRTLVSSGLMVTAPGTMATSSKP